MYPVWEGVLVHPAIVIALIASFHVLASHLTVAGAWFNYYIERKAVLENRPEYYQYLKRSVLGLLTFAYVFGALAGVGIWYSTTAGNPRGISTLIHNFVLYWGSEWYMFMIDVIGITAYYYTFGRVNPKTHLRMAWILALGATGTLAIIVGILSFKLTPGAWLDTGMSLHGFFNPTFWPQLLMRFFLMFAITGVYGVLVASTLPKDAQHRNEIIRTAAGFGLVGLLLGVMVWQLWYLPALPEHARTIMHSAAVPGITYALILMGILVVALFHAFSLAAPKKQTPALAVLVMLLMVVGIFGAERLREVMRKPDIVAGYMSVNQLVFKDLPARGIKSEEVAFNQKGLLGNLPFLNRPGATTIGEAATAPLQGEALIQAGRVLVVQQCSGCHTVSRQTMIGGVALRSVDRLFIQRGMTRADQVESYLGTLGGFPYMHPVVGAAEERKAMAAYLERFITSAQAQR